MTDFAGLVAAVLAEHGEGVTVTVGGTPHPLIAAFNAPFAGTLLNGVPIDRPDPKLVCRASDWVATGAAPGATVERGATVYTVADNAQLDDAGFATVKLREYA